MEHTFGILQYVVVPESDDLVSFAVQPCSSMFVFFDLNSVLTAIEFDDQLGIVAYEIDDIRPYWVLALEFEAFQLSIAQFGP